MIHETIIKSNPARNYYKHPWKKKLGNNFGKNPIPNSGTNFLKKILEGLKKSWLKSMFFHIPFLEESQENYKSLVELWSNEFRGDNWVCVTIKRFFAKRRSAKWALAKLPGIGIPEEMPTRIEKSFLKQYLQKSLKGSQTEFLKVSYENFISSHAISFLHFTLYPNRLKGVRSKFGHIIFFS